MLGLPCQVKIAIPTLTLQFKFCNQSTIDIGVPSTCHLGHHSMSASIFPQGRLLPRHINLNGFSELTRIAACGVYPPKSYQNPEWSKVCDRTSIK